MSPSGYFEHWRRKDTDKPSKAGVSKRISDEALLVHIKAIHAEVKQEYGWPKMWKELVARGIRVGKERVRKLMQRHGIKARGKRKFIVTTDSKHNLPIAENLLERNFTPEAPNRVWTSDITYIATDEGWLYGRKFATRREAMDEVIDWINFYNHKRLHSTLGYVSPMTFEQRWTAAQQQDRKSA